MMNENQFESLTRFTNASSVVAQWTAARDLMAARQLIAVADTPAFTSGFQSLGEEARVGSDISRLIAVDLVLRISKFAKKLVPLAEEMLRDALKYPLPSALLLGESSALPEGAKSAELRENIAAALKYATGEWVIPYVVRSIICEDRSQRCRLELACQLSQRERSIDNWLAWIVEFLLNERVSTTDNLDNSVARLGQVAAALAGAIGKNRSQFVVSEQSGLYLARMCRILAPISPPARLPRRLATSVAEVARLLDEMFAVRLVLITEPETYTVLEVLERWWQSVPYPKQLRGALEPIAEKLATGITFRARWGQKSESLSIRLRQAIGDRAATARRLKEIAENETALLPEIDDWLRGRKRRASDRTSVVARTLQAVANEDLTETIGLLLLEVEELLEIDSVDRAMNFENTARNIANGVKSLGSQRGLKIAGRRGQPVEYSPLAHETVSLEVPPDSAVEIVRPMVVRRRHDGSEDVVVKAIVSYVPV